MADVLKAQKREDIPKEFTWDVESIYPSIEKWEEDFTKIKAAIPKLESFHGTLGTSAAQFLTFIEFTDQLGMQLEQLAAYAHLRHDENNANPTFQALQDRSSTLGTEVSAAASFMTPEILSIPEDRLNSFLAEEPKLQIYRYFLDELLRQKQHVRSAEVESILAQSGEIARSADNIYSLFTNADLKFPVMTDEQGRSVELTRGRYSQFMESPDRRVRKDAFEGMHGTYGQYLNSICASLSGNLKADLFYSRARNYSSTLEAALQPNNIPVEVYHNLVNSVNQNLPRLHRYVALKKKALKLDEIHMYDLYAPLVPNVQKDVTYQEAIEMVLKGLAPLGEDYVKTVDAGIKSRWIDVYESEGKRTGAYSDGSYTTYPFILLNYHGTMTNVFTLAHEMGHSMHSQYTRKTQPYVYGGYAIFVAEVASTLNESLLTQYLIATSEDQKLKAFLINQYLERFRTTLFRQTMFAEFELLVHQKVQMGQPLTPDLLSEIYRDLNIKYYGTGIVVDNEIATEWSEIPHFYWSFYVYQYATGISAAAALSEKILGEGKPAADRYIEFLKSGSSDSPINVLKKAGVDMTTPEPVEKALIVFDRLLDQLDNLLD